MKRRRVLIVGLTVLAVMLVSCLGVNAHEPNVGAEPEPCDLAIVSVNGGTERTSSPEPTSPVLGPAILDTTIVWHCGTPDEPPPVLADAALRSSVRSTRSSPRLIDPCSRGPQRSLNAKVTRRRARASGPGPPPIQKQSRTPRRGRPDVVRADSD